MQPSASAAAIALMTFVSCAIAVAEGIPASKRISSYDQMLPETRAMQDDDTSNPGMLWVLDGKAAWSAKPKTSEKSCADCHGADAASMSGVAARYPALDKKSAKPLTLEGRINACRQDHQGEPALSYESKGLLGLTAFVANQSRGRPIAVDTDALAATIETGRNIYLQRQGQLNLSCANCHDDNWGRKLAGNVIPQGHPTGYPIYRLEWQALGSLQRRLRNCLTGMRAENYQFGSPELVALETYLTARAVGLKIESPAIRP